MPETFRLSLNEQIFLKSVEEHLHFVALSGFLQGRHFLNVESKVIISLLPLFLQSESLHDLSETSLLFDTLILSSSALSCMLSLTSALLLWVGASSYLSCCLLGQHVHCCHWWGSVFGQALVSLLLVGLCWPLSAFVLLLSLSTDN